MQKHFGDTLEELTGSEMFCPSGVWCIVILCGTRFSVKVGCGDAAVWFTTGLLSVAGRRVDQPQGRGYKVSVPGEAA